MAESSSGGRPTLLVAIIGAAALVGVVTGCDDRPCSGDAVPVDINVDTTVCELPIFATQDAHDLETNVAEIKQGSSDQADVAAADETAWAFNQEEAVTEAAWERIQAATWYPNPDCDPNYGATHDANGYAAACVPGDRDYDCPELHDMGIGDIDVIGSDWQRLDGRFDFQSQTWDVPPDGVGCEWTGE